MGSLKKAKSKARTRSGSLIKSSRLNNLTIATPSSLSSPSEPVDCDPDITIVDSDSSLAISPKSSGTKGAASAADSDGDFPPTVPKKSVAKRGAKRDAVESDSDDDSASDSDVPLPKKRRVQPKGKEKAEKPDPMRKLVLYIPQASRDSTQRENLTHTTSFETALDVIHETIGCTDVAIKPQLSYKLSTANNRTSAINLSSVGDWEGCLEEVTQAEINKKSITIPVHIKVTDQYLLSLRAVRGKGKGIGAAKKKGKAPPLLDLQHAQDGEDDFDEGVGLMGKEAKHLEQLQKHYGSCQLCGPTKACKIAADGTHQVLSNNQLRAWSHCLILGHRDKWSYVADTSKCEALSDVFQEVGLRVGLCCSTCETHAAALILCASDPPDMDAANPYPEIGAFFIKLSVHYPRRDLMKYIALFEDLDFFHINEISKLKTVDELILLRIFIAIAILLASTLFVLPIHYPPGCLVPVARTRPPDAHGAHPTPHAVPASASSPKADNAAAVDTSTPSLASAASTGGDSGYATSTETEGLATPGLMSAPASWPTPPAYAGGAGRGAGETIPSTTTHHKKERTRLTFSRIFAQITKLVNEVMSSPPSPNPQHRRDGGDDKLDTRIYHHPSLIRANDISPSQNLVVEDRVTARQLVCKYRAIKEEEGWRWEWMEGSEGTKVVEHGRTSRVADDGVVELAHSMFDSVCSFMQRPQCQKSFSTCWGVERKVNRNWIRSLSKP
ncbi:hypothetical protein B0H14DRAFT_3712367 [Mycena olivaceomarginata]|nr:hypothetical protein B0H14DRAFT_3712367 [Mycena olivaceomarginata]